MPTLTKPSAGEVVCPTCKAEIGQGCKTSSGAPTEWHATRWAALARAKPYTETVQEIRGFNIGDIALRHQATRQVALDGLSVSEAASVLTKAAEGLTEATVQVGLDEGCSCCSEPRVEVVGWLPQT